MARCKIIVLRSVLWFSLPLTSALIGGTSLCSAEPPVVRIALESEPSTLEWNRAKTPIDRFVASFLMRGLLRYGEKNQIECELCQTFTVSDQGRTVRFIIKSDLRWSDGKLLEASHFVEGLKRSTARPQTLKFKATQSQELSLELHEADVSILDFMTRVQAYPKNGNATLGPYVVAEWSKGKRLVLEGNPEFKGSRPVYRVDLAFGRHEEHLKSFRAGKIDILTQPTTEEILSLPQARTLLSPFWATRMLVFNVRKKPYSDLGIRRAASLSFNRTHLEAQLKNGERAAQSLLPAGFPMDPGQNLSTFDESKAQSERHRSVPWPEWVESDLLLKDLPADQMLARFVAEELKRIHVRVKLRALSPSLFQNSLDKGNFDAALVTWTFESGSAFELLREFHSRSKGNWAGWSNPAYDALVARTTLDQRPESVLGAVRTLLKTLQSEDPVLIPLSTPANTFLLNSRVKSFATTRFGDPDLLHIEVLPVLAHSN